MNKNYTVDRKSLGVSPEARFSNVGVIFLSNKKVTEDANSAILHKMLHKARLHAVLVKCPFALSLFC